MSPTGSRGKVSPVRDSWTRINRGQGSNDMTNYGVMVTPQHAVEQILSAIKAANTSATSPQRDKTVEGIIKQLGAGNFKAIEHLVAVGFNLIDRNAPLEQVEEPGHRYVALVRSRYNARHGVVDVVGATLGSLVLAERLAHSEREAALALFMDDRSYYRATRLLEATAAHERTNRQLVDFLRQKAVETEGSRLAVARAD